MSISADGERAARLFIQRWLEQLRTSFVPRRARTLSVHAALDEVLALAESSIRSGGATRPAIDPEASGHGVHMLADVASEAADLITADEVLRRTYPGRKTVVHELVSRLEAKENVTQRSVETLRSVAVVLKRDAVVDGFDLLVQLIATAPKEHRAVVQVAENLVSELRHRGWSDEALEVAGRSALRDSGTDSLNAVQNLRAKVIVDPVAFTCFVAVSLPENRPPFPEEDDTLTVVDALPELPRKGRPPKHGPYLRVSAIAFDQHAAAAIAHRRVLSTLGALTVFLPRTSIDVSSELVAVQVGEQLVTIELQERLLEESRNASTEEQKRILRSTWKASGSNLADPLHDALRLRHRALMARDGESRLLLLWSSLERMTAGARGFDGALSAAKELISKAVVLGKIRRDVGDLVAALNYSVAKHSDKKKELFQLAGMKSSGRKWTDRRRIIGLLMGSEDELRQLTGIIYDIDPLLTFRCHELWKSFGSGSETSRGSRIAEYLERSQLRVERQVGRIYRARNRIAHVGAGPERVRDLVWHAHFYLTQLVAICVHYSEDAPEPAQHILLRRAGQYEALIRLLKTGDPKTITAEALLRPSVVVGR